MMLKGFTFSFFLESFVLRLVVEKNSCLMPSCTMAIMERTEGSGILFSTLYMKIR
jgi:hypothetical protein